LPQYTAGSRAGPGFTVSHIFFLCFPTYK
jgi:hypothetical protein